MESLIEAVVQGFWELGFWRGEEILFQASYSSNCLIFFFLRSSVPHSAAQAVHQVLATVATNQAKQVF